MQVFDRLLESLRQFIAQRDDLILLVPCADCDVALLLQALRGLDRESASDLFLLFGDDFSAPAPFLDRIAERIPEEHRLASETIPPGSPALPAPPPELSDRERQPIARLESGLRYAHSLIDRRAEQRFVWAMAPGAIADSKAYLELLARLAPSPQLRPWMRGARIVARVAADFELRASPLAESKRVCVQPFAIPAEAHEQDLLAAASDPARPLADRMQAEVQLAYLDCAHGRYDPAARRFMQALAFFQWAEIPVMEGLVIAGLGDIARLQGDPKEAEHWYACAAVPAAQAANPVLLANIVQQLAAIAFEEGRFDDAEARYSELVALKRAMLDEDGLAEALEWLGLARERHEHHEQALENWQEAALISKSFDLKPRLESVLQHLQRGYRTLQMADELASFDAQWRA